MTRFRSGKGAPSSPVISGARSGQNSLMRLRKRVAVALCVAAACVAASASVARADGDPASDYRVSRKVFVSSQRVVGSRAQRELLATVAAANRAGFPIRVAIISSDYDMGSITALWRRPALYARFLGLELASAYRGRLLVVMPNGFGLSWPGRPTSQEHALLAKVVIGPGEAGLLGAAQAAVRRLAGADGVAVVSTTARPAGSSHAQGGGSGSVVTVAAAVAVLAVLVTGLLVPMRRRAGRMGRAGPHGAERIGAAHRLRLGVAVPGFAALCVVAVGAPILVLRGTRHDDGTSAGQVGSVITPPPVSWPAGRRRAPDFALRDQNGHAVSFAAYRGRPVIVTFVDPLCRNLCPLEAKVLNDAVGRMPASGRPAILAVSVDVYGGADRRMNLLRDVQKWELVPQWRWVVGRPAQLAAVWRRYEIGVKVTTKRIARTTIHYITHTEAAFIVDASGHERALFLWPFYPQDVERTLRQLA